MSLTFRMFLLLLASTASSALADRDIVYAARYYAPPGSHRTSHFHLYRINPDGTGRTQLTYGNRDDTDPHWSPDGRRIVFVRDVAFLGNGDSVSMTDADGGYLRHLADFGTGDGVTDLRWLPGGRAVSFVHDHETQEGMYQFALWLLDVTTRHVRRIPGLSDYAASPDGHLLFCEGAAGAEIIDRGIGVSQPLPAVLEQAAWLPDGSLVGLDDAHHEHAPTGFLIFGPGDHTGYRVGLVIRAHNPDVRALEDNGPGFVQAIPGTRQAFLLADDTGIGGIKPRYNFYRVRTMDGVARDVALQTQWVVFAPGGRRCCAAHAPSLAPYARRRFPLADDPDVSSADFRQVYTAPLQVGVLGGRLRSIVSGLVSVEGADWRRGTP